ncbi:hypothetical protein ACQJBY_063280 [Aegilops geniculata]
MRQGRCRLGENPSFHPLPSPPRAASPSSQLPRAASLILSRRCCSPSRRPQPPHLDTATMSASERRKAGDWALPYEGPGDHLCARANRRHHQRRGPWPRIAVAGRSVDR